MLTQKWKDRGFAQDPILRVSGGDGLLLFRAWGAGPDGAVSSEWGTGYFSPTKPASVLEAELRANIVLWGNGVHFVSTFRLLPNFAYWMGPVLHEPGDLHLPSEQVFVEQPFRGKLTLVRSKELLLHDVFVGARSGNG